MKYTSDVNSHTLVTSSWGILTNLECKWNKCLYEAWWVATKQKTKKLGQNTKKKIVSMKANENTGSK